MVPWPEKLESEEGLRTQVKNEIGLQSDPCLMLKRWVLTDNCKAIQTLSIKQLHVFSLHSLRASEVNLRPSPVDTDDAMTSHDFMTCVNLILDS